MQQYIFSAAGIQAGTEGKFSTQFKLFDYIFHCFFDTNGKAFSNDDNHMLRVMCGLAALHEAVALGHRKVPLSNGSNLEYMFCPHCGYFINNTLTMNTHVRKLYKAGLFCGGLDCNLVTNKVEAMLQHGSLFHNFGKKNKGTPIKSK